MSQIPELKSKNLCPKCKICRKLKSSIKNDLSVYLRVTKARFINTNSQNNDNFLLDGCGMFYGILPKILANYLYYIKAILDHQKNK